MRALSVAEISSFSWWHLPPTPRSQRRPFCHPEFPIANKYGYAAALLDGEGCISLTRRSVGERSHLSVTIGNTDPRITEWLYQHFGGGVHLGRRRGHYHPLFRWELSGQQARAFLESVRRLVVGKREQVDLILSRSLAGLNLETHRALGVLNQRGHFPAFVGDPVNWVHVSQESPLLRPAYLADLLTRRQRCRQCGEDFAPHQRESAAKFGKRRFCSTKCAHYGRDLGDGGVRARKRRDFLRIARKRCRICRRSFTPRNNEVPCDFAARTYCSRRCAARRASALGLAARWGRRCRPNLVAAPEPPGADERG